MQGSLFNALGNESRVSSAGAPGSRCICSTDRRCRRFEHFHPWGRGHVCLCHCRTASSTSTDLALYQHFLFSLSYLKMIYLFDVQLSVLITLPLVMEFASSLMLGLWNYQKKPIKYINDSVTKWHIFNGTCCIKPSVL